MSEHIESLIATRLSRRSITLGLAALPALTLGDADAALRPAPAAFTPTPATNADVVTVPAGYRAEVLIGWGDALFEGLGPFDPDALTRADQEARFGTNNDMLALFPIEHSYPPRRSASGRYLLCANHEYFDPSLMFPSVTAPNAFTPAQIEAMYASMGVSVVQIAQGGDGAWSVVRDAAPGTGLNRRITPFTPVRFVGPAANHPWIVAAGAAFRAAEPGAPEGAIPCGTHSNCAGGDTPWGTYLTTEENFNGYVLNSDPARSAAAASEALKRDAAIFGWPLDRASRIPVTPELAQFDAAQNPTTASLYGWTVEIDPHDPSFAPQKLTALGRRKGECATTALTRDGRVAVYSGDDQLDEFVYKFISRKRFSPGDRARNRSLLHEGRLYAARFHADGAGEWVAITLTAANAAAAAAGGEPFADEGDLMVRAREAARLLGATPMDRPEDVEAMRDARWVGLGPVLVVCTKSGRARTPGPGRPGRPGSEGDQPNYAGHILRLDETGADAGAVTFRWDVFALGGDPYAAEPLGLTRSGQVLHTSVGGSFVGDRFACPDNICFDSRANVFITTDGSEDVFGDCNDQIVVTSVAGAAPRVVKRFLVGPLGAEICGPMLDPDERTFFCAIQHPGEADAAGNGFRETRWQGGKAPSSWPDGNGAWPRSAVVTVRRTDGGRIGG